MNNEKSYKEIMKSQVFNSHNRKQNFVKELYIEMTLNEAILKRKREKILEKVDRALDTRNKDKFYKLTEELQDLNEQFGA